METETRLVLYAFIMLHNLTPHNVLDKLRVSIVLHEAQ